MTRRRSILAVRAVALAGLAVLILATCPQGSAQQRLASGRALDGSLQVGSGGYNRPVRSRDFVQRPLYTVGQTGEMRYNQYQAFGVQRPFTLRPPGSTDLRYTYENVNRAVPSRMPKVDVPPQPTAGTSIWSPRSTRQFVAAPAYRPAGPGSRARAESATTALGVAPRYQPGASANPYGVSALFGG